MAGNKYLGDEASNQADSLNKAISFNKLIGLMECGLEPHFKAGNWTVEVPDRKHTTTETFSIDNVVIAHLRHYHMAEIVSRGDEMVLTLTKL